jgi:hypothetical protein
MEKEIAMPDFNGYTGPAMVRGDLLPPALQQDALRSYLHRFTGDHRPLWSKKPRDDGRPYPLQFTSDSEWLRRTLFPVTIRKGGRLGEHTKAGRAHAHSSPTWPEGLSDEDKAKAGATVAATVPEWCEGHI